MDRLTMESWVLGYLSGANVFSNSGKDTLSDIDADVLWSRLDSYCRAHPLEKLPDSVRGLAMELHAR